MEFFNTSEKKPVAKGTILLRSGEVNKTAFKVLKGCLKSYVIDKTGKEHIVQFAPEDWFISDIESFYHERPSTVFIDAIENTEVLLISRSNIIDNKLLNQEVLIEMNNKYLNSLIATNKRLIGLLSTSAEERYLEFTHTYPTLVQRLPLKLIAAYIGITPEYLSEIRRKLAKK